MAEAKGNFLTDQDWRCAICGTRLHSKTEAHLDHNHECCSQGCEKCYRGVLCRDCNWGLGRFHDNVEILDSAAAYLESREVNRGL